MQPSYFTEKTKHQINRKGCTGMAQVFNEDILKKLQDVKDVVEGDMLNQLISAADETVEVGKDANAPILQEAATKFGDAAQEMKVLFKSLGEAIDSYMAQVKKTMDALS